MAGRALVEGTKSMIIFLVRATLFPLAWMWALGVAKRHESDDPAARKKVLVAIVAGLIAAPAIGYMIYDFQEDARVGMYDSMEGRLNQILGNASYANQVTNLGAKQIQLDVLGRNLEIARADMIQMESEGNVSGYEEALGRRATLEGNLAIAQREYDNADMYADRLSQESAFFGGIVPHIRAQNDDTVRSAIVARYAAATSGPQELGADLLAAEKDNDLARAANDKAQAELMAIALLQNVRALTAEEQAELEILQAEADKASSKYASTQQAANQALAAAQSAGIELPVPKDVHNSENLPARSDRAMSIKTKAEQDMQGWMVYLLYPGLIGVFYAPLFFALGSVLGRAWEPSESIGFKKYPGASLALFLFFGAFGWPALLFSAWGFKDIEERTQTGQISL